MCSATPESLADDARIRPETATRAKARKRGHLRSRRGAERPRTNAGAREGLPPRNRDNRHRAANAFWRRPSVIRRQDPDLSRLWPRVRVDCWRAGVLSVPRASEPTEPLPILPCRASCRRRWWWRWWLIRRWRRWWWRWLRWWPARDVHRDVLELRTRGSRSVPAPRRQARLLLRLLREAAFNA